MSSYVDPQGFVFHWQGGIHRLVHAEARPLFDKLLRDGTLDRLVQAFHLVPTRRENLDVEDAPGALVLGHDTVWPVTYCTEWTPSMLRDAARVTLDLHAELMGMGLGLQDAYPWNILFAGSRPVFVDVTSITASDTASLWPAQEQFESFFYRPLALAAEGKGDASRALLQDNIDGIGLEAFHRMVSLGYRLRHPGLAVTLMVDRWLQRSAAVKSRARAFAEGAVRGVGADTRHAFIRGLRRRIDELSFDSGGDPWAAYYGSLGPDVDAQAKLGAVTRAVEARRPATLLDLGCNTGVFALRAAELGARVVAVDRSEACVEALYARARQLSADVTPLVGNVLCPAPGGGFLGRQYPPMGERLRADMVLCLGLMHHLHINGRQSFDRIALLMDAVAGKSLVFEFVGLDDANIPHLSGRRPIAYDIDLVEDALRPYFKAIERVASDRPSRCLLICDR